MNSCFIQWVIIHYYLFWCWILPNLFSGSPLELAIVCLRMCHHSLMHFLFYPKKMFQAHLVNSLPQLWNQPFLQGVLDLNEFLETEIWIFSMLIATKSVIASISSRQTELGHTCWTHTCVHRQTHPAEFVWLSPIPIRHHNIHSLLPPFHIWNSLPQQCKMCLPLSSIYFLICLNLEYTKGDFRTSKPHHCKKQTC